jgi:hypothetical protein
MDAIPIVFSYPLYIVTFDRGLHHQTLKPKPYHWAFFIKTSTIEHEMLGIAHQLRDMPGAFHYSAPEAEDLGKSGSKKQVLETGSVEAAKMGGINEILRMDPVEKNEASGWNCQNWSLVALECLRREGFIDDQYTNEMIKYWLREDE